MISENTLLFAGIALGFAGYLYGRSPTLPGMSPRLKSATIEVMSANATKSTDFVTDDTLRQRVPLQMTVGEDPEQWRLRYVQQMAKEEKNFDKYDDPVRKGGEFTAKIMPNRNVPGQSLAYDYAY